MWPFTTPYPELSPEQIEGKTYDYIIVGGGTAGCVLANRLSEDPNVSVLVLEKGRAKNTLMSRIPLASQNMFAGDALQVQSTRWTEPMPGANGRRNRLWAAEGLGGSSRINALLWTRCAPADYEAWASGLGLDLWDWDKVEPYFRRLENAVAHPDSADRGHAGPVQSRQDKSPFVWEDFMKVAAEKTGLRVEKDCNTPASPAMGYFTLDTAVDDKNERISAFAAFLSHKVAVERRKHLAICTGVVASRLELNEEANKVTGVYIRSSLANKTSMPKDVFVKARREVIVCSGAIATPQLLLLSGIGPAKSGSELDIPLRKELPAVGATLSDHYSCPIQLDLPKQETLHMLESIWGLWYFILWIWNGAGIMGMTSTLNSIFVRTDAIDDKTMQVKARESDGTDNLDASKPRDIPNIEIMFIPSTSLERPVPGRSQFSLYPTLVQPRGKGRIELVDRDPLTNPRITYPMFTDDRDLADLRKGVRYTMRLAHEFQNSGYPHPAPFTFAPGNNPELLREWETNLTGEDGPKDGLPALSESGMQRTNKKVDFANLDISAQQTRRWDQVTDDEIDDYVKRVSHSSLHFSSTCPMSNDVERGVVDQRLRVHGISNLRIADASVFPKIPSGHTMAPVMMVAARCADFILEERR